MTDKTEAQPEALRLADEQEAAVATLQNLGYTYQGGMLWKPPLGKAPDFNLLDTLHARIAFLEAQLSARQAAPDGWRLVPVEPTQAMTAAGCPVGEAVDYFDIGTAYRAMLSAAPPPPEREPQTDEQIETAYKNLQVRRKKERDEDFQAGIGKSCTHCSEGHYQADWNGYSTFHRCDKCRHVPFDLSGMVNKSAASCWCETCRPVTLSDMRFIVCPDCGNKRCPKATHHDNACTNSNAPGQPGSSWEHVKTHGATND